MKNSCMALNCCKSGKQSSGGLFRIPEKDSNLRQKWLENLGLTESFLSTKFRPKVCRRHFTPDCIGRGRLFDWSIPTLFLGKTEGLHQPIQQKKILRKCSIRNCNTKGPEILHCFPTHPELRQKWLEICRIKDYKIRLFACRRHFRPSFIHKNRISKNAYPELNLGLEDYDPLHDSEAADSCGMGDEDYENKVDESESKEDVNESKEDEYEDKYENKDAEHMIDDGNKAIYNEQTVDADCKKCKEREIRCHQLLLKITELEQKLQMLEKEEAGEEFIYLLLK